MSWQDLIVWIYLAIGILVFLVEFSRFDDRRKWFVLPIPLLFITLLWPGLLVVNWLDRTRKSVDSDRG